MNASSTLELNANTRRLIAKPALLIGATACEGSGEPIECVDPFTGESLGAVSAAGPDETAAAIAAARRAFDSGSWSELRPAERAQLMMRVLESIDSARDALVELMVAETGCPISLSRSLQVDAMLEHLEWFVEAARKGPAEGFDQQLGIDERSPIASNSLLVREPVGVVAAVTPYNIPLLTAVWKAVGALAAGCTTILVPSPRAALVSMAWSRALLEADLPDGVFSLLVGGPDVGRELTESDSVDMVTFTGSNAVGRHVMRQASGNFKRVVLELGGKSPNLLLPGTDVDAVVGPSILRYCRNAGQACGATTRTFVPRDDYEDYVTRARQYTGEVGVGDPWDPSTVVGPLISREHRDRVEGYVERALSEGASIEAGGGRPDIGPGAFMNPVLVGNVSNRSELARDELFGPVGIVVPYDSVDEAVRMANDSRYGLNANVWGPVDDALGVAARLRSGTVTINGGGGLRPDAPFGGYRESGIGREAGDAGFSEFFELKHIQWPV